MMGTGIIMGWAMSLQGTLLPTALVTHESILPTGRTSFAYTAYLSHELALYRSGVLRVPLATCMTLSILSGARHMPTSSEIYLQSCQPYRAHVPSTCELEAIRREVWKKILFEHGFAPVPLLELTCSCSTKLCWPCVKVPVV